MRLDQHLVKTYSYSRNRAQMIISDGHVLVNAKVITKASCKIGEGDLIEVQENPLGDYVSRSALKLKNFLEGCPDVVVNDSICLDVGASTGGFTQVLLEKSAQRVYSVDVWTNQLHESIKWDKRVLSYEQTDIRDFFDKITPEQTSDISIVTIDVSFVSVTKILPTLWGQLAKDTQYIILYKPQFEVGKQNLTKIGVVKNEKITRKSLEEFRNFCIENNRQIIDLQEASVIGEAGNQEWILRVRISDI